MATVQTSCLSFVKLQQLPVSLRSNQYLPKPLYYDNKSTVLISASTAATTPNPGVYKYNLETNEMHLIYKYEKNFKCFGHNHFMEKDNQIMHIFGKERYCLINLKTKQMQFNPDNKLSLCGTYSSAAYIPPPVNELHVMDVHCHFKYNINNGNTSIVDPQKIINNITYPKILYVAFKKQLMIFGSDDDNRIFYCDSSQKWKLYPLQMPYRIDNGLSVDFILHESLLFVFYFGSSGPNTHKCFDIWCLDLLNTKWYKSIYRIPTDLCILYRPTLYALKGANNSVHLIDFHRGHHHTISISELIPAAVEKVYSVYYQKLVIGYIKQIENDNLIPTIPFVLKLLIWKYFPAFL